MAAQTRRRAQKALDTFVDISAALRGLISVGLRLDEEANSIGACERKGDGPAKPAPAPPVICKVQVEILAKLAKTVAEPSGRRCMHTMSAKDAKYGFGRLIDMARAEPVTVEKHGRPVIVVLAVEEYERLKSIERGQLPTGSRRGREKQAGGD